MKVNNSLIVLLALLCAFLFVASALAVDETKATNEGQLNDETQGHGWDGGGGCHGRGCHGGGGHGGGGNYCRHGCCSGYYRGGGCKQCCRTAQEYSAYNMQNDVNRP
ncbi:glycine-rich protein 3 short isoform-like [Solanum pennellii]|uniref:Glycine-rich protein 3 short isoform-like n=1 Tax=Solanum pennellii TaxID=28526 RepID=A0ABM1FJR5_SOLPN|nr:glycine-rich protein 3 short isoform-like [Solanum pennellii]